MLNRDQQWPATKTRNHETLLVFFVSSCFRGDPSGSGLILFVVQPRGLARALTFDLVIDSEARQRRQLDGCFTRGFFPLIRHDPDRRAAGRREFHDEEWIGAASVRASDAASAPAALDHAASEHDLLEARQSIGSASDRTRDT